MTTNYEKPGGNPTLTTTDPVEDLYQAYEDTSFVVGDSPVTLDFTADVRSSGSYEGYIVCDGVGDITVSMDVNEASGWGDEVTLKKGERLEWRARRVRKLRITRVADSAYRVFAG